MTISDEHLDQLLKTAIPIPPNPNLAERIIAQAATVPVTVSLESHDDSLFKQILRALIIPKPVYVLACSMLLGVLLGWQNTELDMNINPIQIASAEEDLSSVFIAEVNYYE